MDDTSLLIYNELVEMRKDFKSYMDSMDKRVTVLETFKNKAMGILLVIGCAIGYAWDYCKERIF